MPFLAMSDEAREIVEAYHKRGESIPRAELDARVTKRDSGSYLDGTKAVIPLQGPMLSQRDEWLDYFGVQYTVYGELNDQIREASADPAVSELIIKANTGGGEAIPMYATGDILAGVEKPTTVDVDGMLASAGYYVAAHADKIVSSSRANPIGSIGIVQSGWKSSNKVSVTSTNAPNKAPDIGTPEGQEKVRGELDRYEDLMIGGIAKAMNISTDTIKADFGKGGVMPAADAVKVGMIDSIETKETKINKSEKGAVMTITELKAQHPELFAEAHREGVTEERKRVNALTKVCNMYGATDQLAEAIKSGTGLMDAEFQAEVEVMRNASFENKLNAKNLQDTIEGEAPVVQAEEPAAELNEAEKQMKALASNYQEAK